MSNAEVEINDGPAPRLHWRPKPGTLKAILRESSLYLGLALIFLIGILASPDTETGENIFLSGSNQSSVLRSVSRNGILAVGMTLVILTAGIDLSVGRMLGLGSTLAAILLVGKAWSPAAKFTMIAAALSAGVLAAMGARAVLKARTRRREAENGACRRQGESACRCARLDLAVSAVAFIAAALLVAAWVAPQVPVGLSIFTVLVVVPLAGLSLGSLSGIVIAKARLQPFIVTLAMMTSAYGAARLLSDGGKIISLYDRGGNTPPGVDWLRQIDPGAIGAAIQSWAPGAMTRLLQSHFVTNLFNLIPVPGLFFLACLLIGMFVLNRLRFGRYVYAVGGNEEAARLSGVNVDRVKIIVYSVSGMLAFLAGVLDCAMYRQGKADMGQLGELEAIAAVVIGGTSLMGGRGRMLGTLVGVLMFGYLTNILTLRALGTDVQYFITGLIIVDVVMLQEGMLQRLPPAWRVAATFGHLFALGGLITLLKPDLGAWYLIILGVGCVGYLLVLFCRALFAPLRKRA
jgi:simple sugar transport system permease protein